MGLAWRAIVANSGVCGSSGSLASRVALAGERRRRQPMMNLPHRPPRDSKGFRHRVRDEDLGPFGGSLG